MPHKEPQTRRLDDDDAEVVRVSHHAAIRQLQTMPASSLRTILNVELPDGIDVVIPHGLGRVPVMHWISTVRNPQAGILVKLLSFSGTGYIEEFRADVDRSLYIKLRATGFIQTVVVDVAVL